MARPPAGRPPCARWPASTVRTSASSQPDRDFSARRGIVRAKYRTFCSNITRTASVRSSTRGFRTKCLVCTCRESCQCYLKFEMAQMDSSYNRDQVLTIPVKIIMNPHHFPEKVLRVKSTPTVWLISKIPALVTCFHRWFFSPMFGPGGLAKLPMLPANRDSALPLLPEGGPSSSWNGVSGGYGSY